VTAAIETGPDGHDVPAPHEQAALRRVATLVAEGAPVAEVFAAVANEVVQILGVDAVSLDRYEPDRTTTVVAAVNAPAFAVGTRWPLDGPSLSIQVFETGRPARIDDYSGLPGTVAAAARDSGVRSALGVPIIADGAIWGMAWAGTASIDPLPAATEERLRDFAELVAIAISNADSRDRLRRLADQQASLRRVATLVAEGATPTELFSAVAEEVARILDVTSVSVGRYEPDGELAVVASVNDAGFPVGSRWPVEDAGLFMTVLETGRPARIDDYSDLPGAVAAAARASGAQSGVGAPIVVDGRVWGLIAVGRRQRRDALPGFTGSYTGRIVLSAESGQDTEARLSAFTELVATAISRAQAHDDLRSLAEEQAALRRVATLVAEAAAPVDIFAAVVEEIAHLLELPRIEMVRYETDGTATVIGASGDHPFAVGTKWDLAGPSIMASVLETNRSARIDDYSSLPGRIAEVARSAGFRSAIGAPIIVDGRTWGAVVAISTLSEPIPERTDARLSQFTELVATAVSNATARTELIASRARIVSAGDEARRRLERDLHDGTQQRLLALRLDLQRIRGSVPEDEGVTRSGLETAEQDLESVLEEVREFSRGIHPGHLARGGLGPSLRALGRRSPIPVEVEVDLDERPPAPIETAVYYVVSEAITNAIKHSGASVVSVRVVRDGLALRATIADDGVGGAPVDPPRAGSGLTGLSDRVEAIGGGLAMESPTGGGTTLSIELPLGAPPEP
jgi:signal transduction histidine kinase